MLERHRDASPERAQNIDRAGNLLLLGAASAAASFDEGVFLPRLALTLFVPATMLWLIACRLTRQHDAGTGRSFSGDMMLTLLMLGAIVGPLWLLGRALPHGTEGSTGSFALVLVPTVLTLRAGGVGLRLWRARPGVDMLIVGIGPLGRLTGAEVGDCETNRRLLGYLRFDDESPNARLHAPVFGVIEELESTLRERVVDEVYFASTTESHTAAIQAAIRTCEKLGVAFALPWCVYRLTRSQLVDGTAITDGYAHFLTVQNKPLQIAAKRLFDIAASAFALAALSPLFVATAIMVKLGSRGPVLFRQERVGLRGRTFAMLKFRSMVVNAEAEKAKLLSANEQSGPVFKMKRDPRVTAVGRFIRKYSIDELPQLVNVLRGDMSVVGPRPPLPTEVARYEGWQRRRLSVRPGLTCVWQVSGRSEISFQEWMLLDMRYIDHWSLAQDFDLIWRTVPVVLSGRGAS